nr:EAL domain-containing protein [Lysinibacillus timonensis]
MFELVETNELSFTETNLRNALYNNEFTLYYQPKLNLVTGKIVGVEALIRWVHPEKGMISPLEFIPLAEKTGMIQPIGEWVLRTACEQLQAWREIGLPPMIVAVNLSASQLFQRDLVNKVQQILDETGVPPKYLELEITESMMMDIQKTLPIIHNLKKLGVCISMDDFGTGYSSLSYLKEIPIDKLKIDQSFVRNCTTDPKDATIVKTIIAMAHQLNLVVIAEGVETRDQLIFLQQNLCNKAQGYLFSKPVPSEEIVEKFSLMEQMVEQFGISYEENQQNWLEESLEQARQELHDTIRMQQGMIFKFIQLDGKFIHTLCDGELLYQMNLTPAQVIGKELNEIFPKSTVETKLQYYKKVWESKETVIYEGNVGDIWYLATLRPIIRNGKIVEVIGSCVDITKRKKAEESLKQSEYKYRLIADNTQDIISVLDAKGVVHYASPSHEKVLGYPAQVIEGNAMFDFLHPDDASLIKKYYKKAFYSKLPSYYVFRYKHKTGNWVNIEGVGTPVLDEDNEVKQLIVVGRDISQRRQRN